MGFEDDTNWIKRCTMLEVKELNKGKGMGRVNENVQSLGLS